MIKKNRPSKTIYGFLEKDHKISFEKLNRFYEVLKKIRYEGRPSQPRNVAEIRGLVKYFREELGDHMKQEERVLFPFLRSYIPRLEPMVYLLLSEHEDFRHHLEFLRKVLGKSGKDGFMGPRVIDQISEQGTYLTCLLRSHLWVESHSLYRAADKELRPGEKKKLMSQIRA